MKRAARPLRALPLVAALPLGLAASACETIEYGGGPGASTRFGGPVLEDGPVVDERPGEEQPPLQEPLDEGEVEQPGDPGEADPYPDDMIELALRDGFLDGDIGPVLGLSNQATDLTGYASEGWTSVSTTVLDDRRIAMTIVELMGSIDDFEPGRTYEYGADGFAKDAPDAPWLAVVGCAAADDPQEGFDFDQSADLVQVTVEEHEPGVVEIDYAAAYTLYDDAGYASGETVVEGRFVWIRR